MKRKPNKRILYIKKSNIYYFSNQNIFTPFLYTHLNRDTFMIKFFLIKSQNFLSVGSWDTV